MIRSYCLRFCFCLIMFSLFFGCVKKEISKTVAAIPEDAEIVAELDSKALLSYAKQVSSKQLPAGMKDKVPSFDMLVSQAKEMLGIDLEKLGGITFIGYTGSENKMAFITEGVDFKTLKGKKKSEHNGTALYGMDKDVFYAELKGLGVVAGPSEEMLKKVLDVFSGKSKNITKGKHAEMYNQLCAKDKSLNQIRMYVLTGDIPQAAAAPYKLNGGGLFFHLDKGLSVTVASDEKGASSLKTQADQGLMAVQLMAGTGQMNLPIDLDDDLKSTVTGFLNKIKIDKSANFVSVSYSGDLKPLLEKGFAAAMKLMTSNQDSLKAEGSKKESLPTAKKK